MKSKNNISKKIILSVSTLFFINVSMASENWYIGISTGNADFDTNNLEIINNNSSDGFHASDTSYKLILGYHFNDVFSIESSYVDLGNVNDIIYPSGNVSLGQDQLFLQANGFTIAPKVSWNVVEKFSISARLGVSFLNSDKRWNGGTSLIPELVNDVGGSDTELFYGIDLSYHFNDSVSLGVSKDFYKVEEINTDVLSATLIYDF
jgi:hypothetical protein